MTAGTDPPPEVIRHGLKYRFGLAITLVGIALVAIGLYAGVAMLAAFGSATAAGFRLLNVRPRLILGSTTVVVVNLRSHRIARQDIARVDIASYMTGSTAVALRLRDGRTVRCLGCATIGPSGRMGLPWVQRTEQRLNRDLPRH